MRAAWLYDAFLAPFEKLVLGGLRSSLLSRAKGDVLEIGAGTGLNFPHYPADVNVLAIEPAQEMRARAERRAEQKIKVRPGDAEQLDLEAESVDTIVATFLFCSLSDPIRASAEVYRVLKPGGLFLFLEHVRFPQKFLGRLCDVLTPCWSLLSGGCHLNRTIDDWLDAAHGDDEGHWETLERRQLLGGFVEVRILQKPPRV